ncbi:hypothetical protein J132_06254 [Termitomyces sp. J132]|nr:hypothetical protein J132_06254 [Termitomyces sp. J132]
MSERLYSITFQEQVQLGEIRNDSDVKNTKENAVQTLDRDFEGGFGGQEDLEDRYATTSGEH